MASADRIAERLPSLYRPEIDGPDLFTAFVRAIGARLDAISRESSDVMQAHWFAYADGALFDEFVRRSRQVAGEPPVQQGDEIVETLPYLADLPRLAALIDRAPWLDPPASRDRVEDFRRRLADVVAMYRNGLGTVAALRLATRVALPVSDRDAAAGLRTRPFTVEEFAPLREQVLAVRAAGQPLEMVGPLMQWSIDSRSHRAVLPTAFIRGVEPVPGQVDATERPLLERVHITDNTGVGLAYDGVLAPGQALALWPTYSSWLGTASGVDSASSIGASGISANPTAPGPWSGTGSPSGIVVALHHAADRYLYAGVNSGAVGALWRTSGSAWEEVAGSLPPIRCLTGRGAALLIGFATGVSSLDLFDSAATLQPAPASLAGSGVNALVAGPTGVWWAATSSGAARLESDLSLRMVGPGSQPGTATALYAVFVDLDGSVFFGGDLGVFQFQSAQDRWFLYGGAAVDESSPDWLPFDPAAGVLPDGNAVCLPPVRSLLRGPDGALWIGSDAGVGRYLAREHRRTFTTVLEAFPRITQVAVHAIAEDERGQLWFATDTGLLVFDGTDWWQRQAETLVRLAAESSVHPSLQQGASELTFWRFARAEDAWQTFTPTASAGFVSVNPAPLATDQPPVLTLTWTDGVHPQLGAFDGATFMPSAEVAGAVRLRIKPNAVTLHEGGIPALPRVLPGTTTWRYLALEPSAVDEPRAFPAWTIEGRLRPEPQRGAAPLEGRYLADLIVELRDQVFSFNPAAQVWMRWSPRELLSVVVRLQREQPEEVIDPLVLDRVFAEVRRVRPAAVRLGLAVGDELVRVG